MLSKPNARLVSRTIWIIPLQIRIQTTIIIHGFADGIVCSAKFIHEILGVADRGLIATAKMILQRDKYRIGISGIDDVRSTAPSVNCNLVGIVIPEFIQDVKVLYPSVEAVSQLNLEMAVVLYDIKVALIFLVAKTRFVQLFTDVLL